MTHDSYRHRRYTLRLRHYDYSEAGSYFVTICTHKRVCILGELAEGRMQLTEFGGIVDSCWQETPGRFPNIGTDAFVVMPNHVHGIIVLGHDSGHGPSSPSAAGQETVPMGRPSLPQVVAYFKYQTTKAINGIRNSPGCRVWQRGYYDHIVRNERDLALTREYVVNNPAQGEQDTDNPRNVGAR